MKLSKLIKSGFKNLGVNKLRTGLAILGIVIGIGSVIALVSMGEASKLAVQSQIQSIGSNLLTVSPGSQTSGAVRGAPGGATTLTNEDAEVIKISAQITTIKNVSPEYSGRIQVIAGRNNSNSQVVGVEPAYADVRKITVSLGNAKNIKRKIIKLRLKSNDLRNISNHKSTDSGQNNHQKINRHLQNS